MTPAHTTASSPGSPGPQSPGSPAASVRRATEILAEGGFVAFPTETVWGLAASARNEAAVAALGSWKGRAEKQPISVLVSGLGALLEMGFDPDPRARRLIERFWPGPLTLVLPCRSAFAPGIAGRDGGVGVRCSSHPVAAELVRAAESAGLGPLTATSCNRSGEAPAQNEEEARALCAREPQGPYLLSAEGRVFPPGEPSTVLDLTGASPRILREGGIDAATMQPFMETGEIISGASSKTSSLGDARR